MKKIRAVVLSILAMVLVAVIAVFGYRNSVISKAKTGYLLYAENNIMVIDLETNVKNEYTVDGYSVDGSIGKYYGGDFCCVATNNETTKQEILLFKNGTLEKSYPITENVLSPFAYNDSVYYLTEDGNLNCLSDGKTELIASDINEFALNDLGGIAYIKEILDEDYSTESTINGELYYYANGTVRKLGEVCSIVWLSDNQLLADTEKVDKVYDTDGELVSAGHTWESYIISIENNEWTISPEFSEIPSIVDISSDGKKAIVTQPKDMSFETLIFGIYDIEKDICDKNAIYDGVNYEEVFGDMGANTLWLDENPMN